MNKEKTELIKLANLGTRIKENKFSNRSLIHKFILKSIEYIEKYPIVLDYNIELRIKELKQEYEEHSRYLNAHLKLIINYLNSNKMW